MSNPAMRVEHAAPRRHRSIAHAFPPAAQRIRNAAVRALLDEVVTFPKPGLVSCIDRGSHDDMDAATFFRSAFALRSYFAEIARAGRRDADFATLRALGIAAEARMNAATGGINTHRGAIFTIGLLAAAAGTHGKPEELGAVVHARWGDELRAHRRRAASHGSVAQRRHGAGGALAEAARGFPQVFEIVLPAYRAALADGASFAQARVQAFFMSMATLDDTNLLHRGGPDGLAHARRAARTFLDTGGILAPDGRVRALAIHRDFCARRLSPGGSADLLAAALFVDTLCVERPGR